MIYVVYLAFFLLFQPLLSIVGKITAQTVEKFPRFRPLSFQRLCNAAGRRASADLYAARCSTQVVLRTIESRRASRDSCPLRFSGRRAAASIHQHCAHRARPPSRSHCYISTPSATTNNYAARRSPSNPRLILIVHFLHLFRPVYTKQIIADRAARLNADIGQPLIRPPQAFQILRVNM